MVDNTINDSTTIADGGKDMVLAGRGSITREAADARAAEDYDAYNRQLKFESDFDKQIKRFLDGSGPRAREVPPNDTPSR